MVQVTVWLHTDEFSFVWLYKNENGRETTPRAPKLSYFDGRAQQLSARVNHGTPAAGVISHMYNIQTSTGVAGGYSIISLVFYPKTFV